MSGTMRAAWCEQHGAPDSVAVATRPIPEPGPGQVRVRVHAGAVNFPDVLIVANEYQIKVPTPFVVGSELAGVVDAIGDGVDDVAVGARVMGASLVGAFAEYVVVYAAALTPVPPNVDDVHAAAFGVGHRTAHHVLRSIAKVQPGDEVVVLGAGGGVGLATVQLATVLGGRVTAVASTHDKLDAARAYGAAHAISHRDADLRTALKDALPHGADVVVDPVGGDLAEPALRALHHGGRFVTVGYAAGSIPRIPLNLVLLKGITIAGFEFGAFMTHHADEMQRNEAELLALLAEGRATPHVGATFALDDVVSALELVGTGRAVGKVVITID
jgi:NADPH2:quinone reductase